MSTITTGKQDVSFNWYSGTSLDHIKKVEVTKPDFTVAPTLPSQINIHVADILADRSIPVSYSQPIRSSPPSSSLTDSPSIPLPHIPKNSHSLHSHVDPSCGVSIDIKKEVSPIVDRIVYNSSPMEPSRIRQIPIQESISTSLGNLHIGSHKHSLPNGKETLPEELPLKRQKTSLILPSAATTDVEVISATPGADIEIVAPESLINSQIIQRASSLIDSIVDVKDDLIEKGSELMDSAKSVLTTSPLKQTLDEIAQESTESYQRPNTTAGEPIQFKWPRQVPAEVLKAEELARSERMERRTDPVLFGKWKVINRELKQTRSESFPLLPIKKDVLKKSGLVQALDGARNFTIDVIGHLGSSVQDLMHPTFKNLSELEYVRLLEEKERARRINESLLDPSVDAKKQMVEREMLKTVNSLKNISLTL